LWEEHQYISTLSWQLTLSDTPSSPTFKFDPLYSDIFSRHPELTFVLKSQTMVLYNDLSDVLEILGYSYRIFQPFVGVSELLDIPYGDSPVDFLNDRARAGELYSSPQDIAEPLVLAVVNHIQEILFGGALMHHL
jgi:hypothetical protein